MKKIPFLLLIFALTILCLAESALAGGALDDFSIPVPDDAETLDNGFLLDPPDQYCDDGFIIQVQSDGMTVVPFEEDVSATDIIVVSIDSSEEETTMS